MQVILDSGSDDMLNRKKVVVFAIINTVMIAVFLSQIWRLTADIKEYENALREINSKNEEYLANLGQIKGIIDDSSNSFTDIIRNTAQFVHDNSLHLTDQEYHQYIRGNANTVIPEVIKKLLLAYQSDKSKKPHIACGLRSYAMRTILQQFGIYSRLISIFSDEYEYPENHRLVEVLHPDTGAWEVWDPDFRVSFVYHDSRKPADIMDLLFGDIERIIPVNASIEGWEETNTKHLKDDFFEALMFEGIFQNTPGNIIIVNQKRFDIHKTFSNGLTFTEFAKKTYKNHRAILLPIEAERK